MSKILELLNYSKKKTEGDNPDKYLLSQEFDSSTRKKLANTYIFNQASKHAESQGVSNNKFLGSIGKEKKRVALVQIFPWMISFLAVILLLVNIAYRGKVSVNIQFLDPSVSQTKESDSSQGPAKTMETETPVADYESNTSVITSMIVKGRLNPNIIKKLGFYGAALNMSRMTRDGIMLFNDGSTEWASVGMDLAKPMDLSNSTLEFFVKGLSGKESLQLTLRDINSDSYLPQTKHIIFNRNMAADWQFVSIGLGDFNTSCDTKNIKHIGFEFGTQTMFNEPGISIYIKNMRISKKLEDTR